MFLLVPHQVSSSGATLWIGAITESGVPADLALEWAGGRASLQPTWQHWASRDGRHRVDYQRLTLTGLRPRTTYGVGLSDGPRWFADARVTTLPDRLPAGAEKPFTALVGSCFYEPNDQAGAAGRTYLRLPGGLRPDVKFLCGDQVYLDAPWQHYIRTTHGVEELERRLLRTYVSTWAQTGPGFRDLLKSGSNYFGSDDHELWNNAPEKSPFVLDTWFPPIKNRRKDWLRIARELYRVFQATSNLTTFSVEPLSFCVADTRLDRSSNQTTFMQAGDLGALGSWVAGLRGPGVLVLGQPVLTGRTGILGEVTDWKLADFDQYRELVRILSRSRQTIVVLTGDVHFGRVAVCTFASGAMLIEIISSPLSLVDERARGKWTRAPDRFPAFEVPGVVRAPVDTLDFRRSDHQFATVEFTGRPRVEMKVRFWPISATPPGALEPTFERSFDLGIGAIS